MTRLSAIVLFAALLYKPSPGLAATAPSLGKASGFAALAGMAVTCTNNTGSIVTGDVGVWPGNTFTNSPPCTIVGTVHLGDGVAKQAYMDFINAYNNLLNTPPTCDATLSSTIAPSLPLPPGVYCFTAAVAMTGQTLYLQGDANAVWIFLVNGALTGTNFDVVMLNGGDPCNVYWRTGQAAGATLTDSNFLGTIFSGAAITVTRGTFHGDALATTAVSLTNVTTVTACQATHGNVQGKCNQGVGNGPEGCDPGNSNNHNPSNDELGGTRGAPGRKP